jgi:predicted ATPase
LNWRLDAKLLPPALLTRLDMRLPLLIGGAQDIPIRLRTMEDAIGWSYDLLDDAQRSLFRQLAVFEGGCTLEAAEAICARPGSRDLDVLGGSWRSLTKPYPPN